jgi:exoribonuclease II
VLGTYASLLRKSIGLSPEIDISHLSIDQLYTLNQYVCERVDELQKQQDEAALAILRPGMKVQFTHDGATITGTLLKKNRKTVLIANNNGKTHHKVPAGIVRPVNVATLDLSQAVKNGLK